MNDRNRRGLGSRNPVGRPRKVAGRTTPPAEPAEPDPVVEPTSAVEPAEPVAEPTEPVVPPASAPAASVVETEPVVEQRAPASVVETPELEAGPVPETEPADESPDGGTRGRRTTAGLVAAIVLLLLVGAGEVLYLVHDPTPAVSAERPVVTGDLTHRAAVEAAARSTEQILSTSYQDYDKQVEQATEQMTGSFAKQYQATAQGIRSRFIAQKTQLQVKAVAQGVVQASPSQVQALLFLNQYVQKVDHGKSSTSYAQYRALVTVVHTDHGWLVSDLQTQ